MRVTLIHNPGAGDDDQPGPETLQNLIRRHGHTVRYQSSAEPTWAAVLDEPADIVAVAGGDGTVGGVAKKLIGRDMTLAPLPLGTANNISRTLQLADTDLDHIVAGWEHGRRVTFDAGIAVGPWGTRYFIEAVGIGLFARAIPAADRSRTLAKLKDADSKLAYAIGMLRDRLEHCAPHRLNLKLDGAALSDDFVLFEAMNMEFVGPNLYLAPDIRSDDGLLDIVLVTTHERDELRQSLADWHRGDLSRPNLRRRRASAIELEWTGFEVHIDDETWPPKGFRDDAKRGRIDIGVERQALRFLAPAPPGDQS